SRRASPRRFTPFSHTSGRPAHQPKAAEFLRRDVRCPSRPRYTHISRMSKMSMRKRPLKRYRSERHAPRLELESEIPLRGEWPVWWAAAVTREYPDTPALGRAARGRGDGHPF